MSRIRLWWGGILAVATLCPLMSPAHASLSEVSTLPTALASGIQSAAIDGADGFGFFASSNPVTLPTISSASLVPEIELAGPGKVFGQFGYDGVFSSFTNLTAAAFDPTTGFGYFTSSGTVGPSGIEKLPLALQAGFVSSSATLPSSDNWIGTMVLDTANQFAYLGTYTSPASVLKVQLSNLTIVSTLTLPSGLSYLSASLIDPQTGFAYFASSTTPGAVAKIELTNFTLAGTLTFSGAGGVASAVIDTTNNLAYFGTNDSPGKVVKVQLGSLALNNTLTLKTGENDLTSAVFDPTIGMAFFGTNTSSGIVVGVLTSGLSEDESLTLGAGQNFLQSAIIDTTNSYAYFGTYTAPGIVIQVDLLAGLPQILSQPTNASGHPGNTVTFSVSAIGRGVTYQWEMNGVAISGATSSSYSRVVQATDDGASFQCVLTGTNGSVISNSAVLTVIPVIRVYPNPWRSDRYAGIPETFDGLLTNSTIKIFDLAAHWVKTISNASGSVTWDLTNDQGQRLASGYYFYIVTTGNSQQTVEGKLAIIH